MASVTINFSAAHSVRIQDALEEAIGFVDEEGEPRAATVADLKNYIIQDLTRFVLTSERRVARQTAQAVITSVDIT